MSNYSDPVRRARQLIDEKNAELAVRRRSAAINGDREETVEQLRNKIALVLFSSKERQALVAAIGFYINEFGATYDLVVNDSPTCRTLRNLLDRLRGDDE